MGARSQAAAAAEEGGGPGPAAGRLNEFQRTMLQWSADAPYNAVHVARVSDRIDPARFSARAARVLLAAGLTHYRVEGRSGRYRYEGGPAPVEVREIPGGSDPLAAVAAEMERQLNLPFPCDGPFLPFRFFLVGAGGETFAGLAYFHAVADADAIARLLLEILAAVRDGTSGPLRDRGLSRRESSRAPFGHPFAALRRVRGSYRKFQAMRRSHRSPVCPPGGSENRCFLRSLGSGPSAAALSRARERGATFNDLCLAALLQAADPATRERAGRRRDHLSAGCVVNLRGELPPGRRGDFGLFLGSFSVTHPVPEGGGFDGLLADIHDQTAAVKREKLYLASALEYRVNRFFYARQKPEKRANFYRKAFPVWGSLTNFKMESGASTERAGVTDYLRAVSTGPALPYVVSATGIAGRLNFTFSYRPGLLPEAEVAAVADRFLAALAGEEAPA